METNFIPQERISPLKKLEGDLSNTDESFDNPVVITDFTTFHALPEFSGSRANDDENQNDEEQDYLAGVEAGKAEAAAVYESTIKVMESTLDQLKHAFQTQVKDIEESHARVVLSCLETVLPKAAHHILLSEMKAALDQACASGVADEVVIKTHSSNNVAKDFLSKLGPSKFTLVEDDAQGDTAVSISFANTQTDIDPIQAATQCLTLLTGVPEGAISQSQSDSHNTVEASK